MRARAMVTAMCLAVLVPGCSNGPRRPSAGHFRIDVESVSEQDHLVIARLTLAFSGSRSVRLFEGRDASMLTVDPAPGEAFAGCEVLLVADLIGGGEEQRVKWLCQIRSTGYTSGGVGGPSTYAMESGQSLDDLLDVRVRSGEYALGSGVDVAVFRGQMLRLRVE